MKTFIASHWEGMCAPGGAGNIVWSALRIVILVIAGVLGWLLHATLVQPGTLSITSNLFVAVSSFGTFLASFVLTLMNNLTKRQLDLVDDHDSVKKHADRLEWLMTDQLIMVVSSLLAAASALLWLVVQAIAGASTPLLTATSFAFSALALTCAARLPFQIFEVQHYVLQEEKRRATKRINDEVKRMFQDAGSGNAG